MGAFNMTLARAGNATVSGEDAFFEPRRRRGRTVVDAQMAAKAAALLASGMSGSACARHLGIPPTTFNENRRAGVIAAPAPALAAVVDAPQVATDHPTSANTEPAAATDRTTRDARDKHVERRTRAGLLTEATPVFAEQPTASLAAPSSRRRADLLDAASRLPVSTKWSAVNAATSATLVPATLRRKLGCSPAARLASGTGSAAGPPRTTTTGPRWPWTAT